MADRKYVLTDETIEFYGAILYRIKAIKDFGSVKKGDLGGWIEDEDNLSQEGNCWIYDNAKVLTNAWVCDNATVYDNAIVCAHARLRDNVKVRDNAKIYFHACIWHNAEVYGNAEVWDALVTDNATVYGNSKVYGDAHILGDAKIEFDKDYAVYKNTWSSGDYITWTRSNNMWDVGSFHGTSEELIAKAYKDSELSGKCYEAIVKAQEEISKLNN